MPYADDEQFPERRPAAAARLARGEIRVDEMISWLSRFPQGAMVRGSGDLSVHTKYAPGSGRFWDAPFDIPDAMVAMLIEHDAAT